jgi:hypothetical protein
MSDTDLPLEDSPVDDSPPPEPVLVAHVDGDGMLVCLTFDVDAIVEPDRAVALPDDYGARPYRWTGKAFEPDLERARADLWEKVKAKRLAVEEGGCETPLGPMDTDMGSQHRVDGASLMAKIAADAGQPFSVDWTMADNQDVTHNATAMLAAGVTVGTHVKTCRAVATALRARINASATFADLDAIDIEAAPWPPNGEARADD